MKYYQNYMSEVVIRVDGDRRYAKDRNHLEEIDVTDVPKDCESFWGGQSYGIIYALGRITKEDYDTYGIKWDFGSSESDRVIL